MHRVIVAALVAGALSSCASATLVTPFDPAAAAFSERAGTAVISGQAFLRRNDGIVVYAAGSDVALVPKTAYSDERMQKIYGEGKISQATDLGVGVTFTNDDPRFARTVRTVIADGEGKFTFTGVPAGSYYLTTQVIWRAQYVQGGALMERVTVLDGQTANVIMTGQ